jgi:hypothetical protein
MQPAHRSFLPSRDGFAFPNSWPSAAGVCVPTPVGSIGIGNAARGLCGGMVFAALDYWHDQSVPPRTQPAPGAALYKFIVRRLIESWHIPAGVARYYQWMTLPDRDARLVIRDRRVTVTGVWRRTVEREWPRVRATIDAGQPAALGVVTVASANPLLLGHNHQVLAYRYEAAGPQVTLAVYDPNSGPDDRVRIRFDSSRRDAFAHNLNIGRPVRGFFLTAYAPATPPGRAG